jgi:hypothetical protein
MNMFKGTDRPPTSRSIRPTQEEFGMAYRARAPWSRSVRSSRRSHDRPWSPGEPERRAKGHRCLQINNDGEVREMRDAATVLEIIRERGKRGLPLERVYRCLFNPDLYLVAYGKLYRNAGAMTPGTTRETVDGMNLSARSRRSSPRSARSDTGGLRCGAPTSRRKEQRRNAR